MQPSPYTPGEIARTVPGRAQQIAEVDERTTFRMIVRSTGTFPTGSTGTASAYEEANLTCGTNP